VPSSKPSAQPSTQPTSTPTVVPSPALMTVASFSVIHYFSDANSTEVNDDAYASTAISNAVAESLDSDVKPKDVEITAIDDIISRRKLWMTLNSTLIMSIEYVVTFRVFGTEDLVGSTYTNLTTSLLDATTNGNFTESLQKFADIFSASSVSSAVSFGIFNVSSYSILTFRSPRPSSLPTNKPKHHSKMILSIEEIVAISAAGAMFIIMILFCFSYEHSKKFKATNKGG
jgi:hypothetical protein